MYQKQFVTIRQFRENGWGLDHSVWVHNPNNYSLHVLTYDVLVKGCVRVEYHAGPVFMSDVPFIPWNASERKGK